jgi:hypothetical protein
VHRGPAGGTGLWSGPGSRFAPTALDTSGCRWRQVQQAPDNDAGPEPAFDPIGN